MGAGVIWSAKSKTFDTSQEVPFSQFIFNHIWKENFPLQVGSRGPYIYQQEIY